MYYDTVKSSIRCQELGVIQGSKTGPLFFDIYSSDFARMCSNDESILYADDTVLVYVGTNLEELTDHVNNRLRNILDWCNCNKLSLNPLKSEFMVVTNKRIETRPQLFIGANQIKEVKSFKYLGIYIDTQLKFSAQIKHLKSKLSQLCGVSFRLSKFLNFQAAKNMYNSCIYSVISYCIGVWGGVSQCTSRCNVLNRIHKRILKNLFSKFFQNSRCIFKDAKILKIDQIYQLNVASYMYNILKQRKYPMLRPSLCISYPSHNYLTRNSNEMLLPFPRVEAIRMNFKYQFVKVWLEVPEYIKCKRTFRQFRNSLSEFYLTQY